MLSRCRRCFGAPSPLLLPVSIFRVPFNYRCRPMKCAGCATMLVRARTPSCKFCCPVMTSDARDWRRGRVGHCKYINPFPATSVASHAAGEFQPTVPSCTFDFKRDEPSTPHSPAGVAPLHPAGRAPCCVTSSASPSFVASSSPLLRQWRGTLAKHAKGGE